VNRDRVAVALIAVVAVLALARHVLIPVLIAVAGLAVLGALVRWAFLPRRRLPRNRVRHMRLRLLLRLHPGHGHATHWELWKRWGRFAGFRESKRIRPSLAKRRWYRLTHPDCHSFLIAHAHHRRQLRVPVQEHGVIIAPPRAYKTALLTRLVIRAPGAVVNSSSKPDSYRLTSGLRAGVGPVYTFDPQGIGDIPSNVRWSPLSGCLRPAVAIRRGQAFAAAVNCEGAEDAAFWRRESATGLQGLFAAAALADQDMLKVGRWAGVYSETPDAVAVLEEAERGEWAAKLAELNGPAEKTAQTIRTVMTSALSFLHDPELAAAVLPAPGQEFDIGRFLAERGTLYMIAKGDDNDSTLAPLFAALACEIQYQATLIASAMPGGRLDPPLLLALDEVTNICPVPLPRWLADSGGQGISIWAAFHGVAQLEERWKRVGARIVMDTANCKIFLGGLGDPDTLETASKLCDRSAYTVGDRDSHELVMTPGMIRQLPPGFALILRGGLSPVVGRLVRGWEHRPYKRLKRRGEHIAPVTLPPMPAPPPAAPVNTSPSAPVTASADSGRTLVLVPAPAPWLAESANGNGNGNGHRKNGEYPWSSK
jgi:type IV secretion system protein VirD4